MIYIMGFFTPSFFPYPGLVMELFHDLTRIWMNEKKNFSLLTCPYQPMKIHLFIKPSFHVLFLIFSQRTHQTNSRKYVDH